MKLIIILFLSTVSLFSQNINGIVFDLENKTPLENVSLYFKNGKGTVTNAKGEFEIRLEMNKADSIRFSHIGYSTKHLTFTQLKATNFKVFLSKKVEQLDNVNVYNKKSLKSKITFKKMASLKKAVHSFGSQIIDNKIYLISGNNSYLEDTGKKAFLEVQSIAESKISDFLKRLAVNPNTELYSSDLQVYNIENNSWKTSKLKFRKRAYHNINYLNDYIYILGGKRLSINRKKEYLDETIEVYNLKTNSLIVDHTNPHQAVNFASFTFNNNLIVMGGSVKLKANGEKVYTNKSHLFDIKSGYWYELKSMSVAKEVKGLLINNIVYLIGGYNEKPLTEIETYNINKGTWENEGHLFKGIAYPSLTYFKNVSNFLLV